MMNRVLHPTEILHLDYTPGEMVNVNVTHLHFQMNILFVSRSDFYDGVYARLTMFAIENPITKIDSGVFDCLRLATTIKIPRNSRMTWATELNCLRNVRFVMFNDETDDFINIMNNPPSLVTLRYNHFNYTLFDSSSSYRDIGFYNWLVELEGSFNNALSDYESETLETMRLMTHHLINIGISELAQHKIRQFLDIRSYTGYCSWNHSHFLRQYTNHYDYQCWSWFEDKIEDDHWTNGQWYDQHSNVINSIVPAVENELPDLLPFNDNVDDLPIQPANENADNELVQGEDGLLIEENEVNEIFFRHDYQQDVDNSPSIHGIIAVNMPNIHGLIELDGIANDNNMNNRQGTDSSDESLFSD